MWSVCWAPQGGQAREVAPQVCVGHTEDATGVLPVGVRSVQWLVRSGCGAPSLILYQNDVRDGQ